MQENFHSLQIFYAQQIILQTLLECLSIQHLNSTQAPEGISAPLLRDAESASTLLSDAKSTPAGGRGPPERISTVLIRTGLMLRHVLA